MTCPWPCDNDCPELCHEVHLVAYKRTHEWAECPAVREVHRACAVSLTDVRGVSWCEHGARLS